MGASVLFPTREGGLVGTRILVTLRNLSNVDTNGSRGEHGTTTYGTFWNCFARCCAVYPIRITATLHGGVEISGSRNSKESRDEMVVLSDVCSALASLEDMFVRYTWLIFAYCIAKRNYHFRRATPAQETFDALNVYVTVRLNVLCLAIVEFLMR